MVHLDTNNNVKYINLEKLGIKNADSVSRILDDFSPKVIQLGGCPVCKKGSINKTITWYGLLLAIFLFPFGIWFCLATRENKCSDCQAIYE